MEQKDKLMIYFGLLVFALQLLGGFIQKTFLTGWIYAVVWFILLIVFYRDKNPIPQKPLFFIVLYLIVVGIYKARGGTYAHWASMWNILSFIVNVMFPFAFSCLLLERGNKRSVFLTIGTIMSIMIFYTISTARLTSVDPMMVRLSIHDEALRKSMGRMGMCSYALPHAAPFIVPALVFAIKHTKKILVKIVWAVFLFFDFRLIFVGGASTPLLLFLVALLLSIIISPKKNKKSNGFLLIIVGLCCMPILNDEVLLSLLKPLENVTEDSPFRSKVIDLENTLYYDEASGDVKSRTEKYMATIDAIASNILFGTPDSSQLGGHSYFLDVIASVGLFSVFLFCYLFFVFRHINKKLPESARLFYLLCFVLYVIECSIKNIDSFEYYAYTFTLAPAICLVSGFATESSNSYFYE